MGIVKCYVETSIGGVFVENLSKMQEVEDSSLIFNSTVIKEVFAVNNSYQFFKEVLTCLS